ncbi:hypothetical protein PRUB_a1451 [Pseudoalteromonas rubra]|uniref:Uncharacterized protein n=1 Tax=Pseudoalteromonas rubra TaxID=43658 RepID=A0A8T0C8U1_9GAMM|nr:hypothetical protein PRUB_a1451 [Pseudoalteromonas rubra]
MRANLIALSPHLARFLSHPEARECLMKWAFVIWSWCG